MKKIDNIKLSENQNYLIDGIIPVQISLIDSMYNVTDHGIYRVVYNDYVVGILIVSSTATSYEEPHTVQIYIGPYKLVRTKITNSYNRPDYYIYNNVFVDPQYIRNYACIQDRYYNNATGKWSDWSESNADIKIVFNQDTLNKTNGVYSINIENTDNNIDIYKTDGSTAIINLSSQFMNIINSYNQQIETLSNQVSTLEDQVKQLIGTNAEINISVTPNVYQNTDEDITFSIDVTISGIDEYDIESLVLRNITTGDRIQGADLYIDGLTYHGVQTLPSSGSYTFEATLKVYGVDAIIRKSVTTRVENLQYRQMWLGGGNSTEEVLNDTDKLYDISNGVTGTYRVVLPERQYLYLIIPADVQFNELLMTFQIPITLDGTITKDGVTYRIYKSNLSFKANTYNIEIK